MTQPPDPRRLAAVALIATLAIQVYTSLASTATAVLAPALAADLGIAPRWIGVFVGLEYVGAMLASLVCGGLILRHGAIRVSQACVLLCAVGVVLIGVLPASAVGVLALVAIAIGFGYGPITPASSHVLTRTTDPARMGLVFSIKQTGVPAGTALAGAALPGLALAWGWRATLVGVGVLGILIILGAQPVRAPLDADRRKDARVSLAAMFASLATVVREPPLRELALIGFAYAATQVCLTSFLVVHLTETLHWSLVSAGLALTVATLGGVAGRIAWGHAADRLGRPRTVLAGLGLVAATCAAAMAFAGPEWPALLVLVIGGVFGATAIGWNGVQLAEIARRAPQGHAVTITGAANFVTFSGVVVGPMVFAAIAAGGSYRAGFAMLTVISGYAGASLLRNRASGQPA